MVMIMKKTVMILIAFLLSILALVGISVLASSPDETTEAGDLTYYAANCVDASATDPASAIMEQSFNGTNFSRFDATAVGQYITYVLTVPESSEYKVSVTLRVHGSCGIADLYINGEKYGEIDNATGTPNALKTISLGKMTLKKGENTFKFVITKPNPNPTESRVYFLNVMKFELRVPKDPS